MTQEALTWLRVTPRGTYCDATLGEGGHTRAIAAAAGPDARLIALDRDPSALEHARAQLRAEAPQVRAVKARFSYLPDVLAGLGIEALDGILFDLGLCSAQLDDECRGFSFQRSKRNALLDMRMDPEHGLSAAELLARSDAHALGEILRAGGVPRPRRAAATLLRHAPLRTVGDLLDAIGDLHLPSRRHHPATLVFQALRMAVNEELAELDAGLAAARDVLAPGGRLVVLSYHSGEDRRVKQFLAGEARGCICPPGLPLCGCGRTPTLRILCSGLKPDPSEVAANPRARSARLRAAERLASGERS
jgi:16S rRNA (cytosine1402-N4)-methyltransferase